MQSRIRCAAALGAVAALAFARPAAAQTEVRFTGFTNGCFTPVGGIPCTPAITNALVPAVADPAGVLTYYNARFDETTVSSFLALGGNPQAGVLNFNNLGAMALDVGAAGAGTVFDNVGFALAVTFTAPTPLNPIQVGCAPVPIDGNTISFTALLRGTVRANATGGVNVNFANNGLNLFSVDTDQSPADDDFIFSFLLADLNVNPDVTPASVTANIQAIGGVFPTAVPEPSTYALLASGLAGVAFAGYRRRRAAR
jgi:hypothetical protein